MARPGTLIRIGIFPILLATDVLATSTPVKIDATPAALAHAMQGHRVVLLGEIHDNAAQHTLRAAALRQLLDAGARPAIAFEQFDRDHQAAIDQARRERPRDADYLIRRAGADPAWRWELYRPFVTLALEYELPIVAANLSRADAMRVARSGWLATFDSNTVHELALDALPGGFLKKHEEAIARGHCDLLPTAMRAPRARAQIARDITMARLIQPYLDRGVVLLAGNGHVRRDIGVAAWLPPEAARNAIGIGLLEGDENHAAPESAANFDAYVITERARRKDPCDELRQRRR